MFVYSDLVKKKYLNTWIRFSGPQMYIQVLDFILQYIIFRRNQIMCCYDSNLFKCPHPVVVPCASTWARVLPAT